MKSQSYPGVDYPIPRAGSQDWSGLVLMLKGMAENSQLRADELTRPDVLRAESRATAAAYHFAALMIEQQYYPPLPHERSYSH